MANKCIPEETVEKIVELDETGVSHRAIGRALGISDKTVRKYLKKDSDEQFLNENNPEFVKVRENFISFAGDWGGDTREYE